MTKRRVPKRLVGLTGSIASGKSTVLAYLARCGAQTLSCDELVQELYQTAPVQRQLKKWFGSARPEEVSRVVFSSQAARRKLERFLHPLVWKLARQRLSACSKTWAVLEVPLLFEAGWQDRMDLTVLVAAGARTLEKRLRARGLSKPQYQARVKTQLPQEEKMRLADVILYNEGPKQILAAKTKRLYQALETFYA